MINQSYLIVSNVFKQITQNEKQKVISIKRKLIINCSMLKTVIKKGTYIINL